MLVKIGLGMPARCYLFRDCVNRETDFFLDVLEKKRLTCGTKQMLTDMSQHAHPVQGCGNGKRTT